MAIKPHSAGVASLLPVVVLITKSYMAFITAFSCWRLRIATSLSSITSPAFESASLLGRARKANVYEAENIVRLLMKGLISTGFTRRQGCPCFGLFQDVPICGEEYEEQDFGKELKIHNGLLNPTRTNKWQELTEKRFSR